MKETVIIVDDTPINLMIMANCLSHAGYRVLVAEDGETAIRQASHTEPDLIVLDIMMPEMDGYETCQRLKAQKNTKDIPILFMTARSETAEKVKGFQMGAVDYITKPFQQEEVLARIKTHLTIARQKRELENMLTERNRFMNIAAHDLRNPLTAILGWSELGMATAETAALKNILRNVLNSGEQMKAIIQDFLTLQVIHTQPGKGQTADFNLQEVIGMVINQQNFGAENKQITLAIDQPQEPAEAHGSLAHTHQIISNYVSNAIKYSPAHTQIKISTHKKENQWRIEVQDQGPGVAVEEREKLFVEFAKVSNKPTGGETSTGLGLAIVRNLAKAQGSKVGADFPASGGSTFWLEISMVASN